MKYGELSFEYENAFRQSEHDGRKKLIEHLREIAFDLLKRYAHKDGGPTDNDSCILLSIFVRGRAESTPGERAAAELLSACVHWLESQSNEWADKVFRLLARLDADDIAAGDGFRRSQSDKASLERPKLNESGESRDDIIRHLARTHRNEGPGEVWPHFGAALEEWSGGEVREIRPDEKERDTWIYRYERAGEPDGISFRTFRGALKKFKTGN